MPLAVTQANALLSLTNDCPCPGHNITFECTVTGGGTTVWQGSGVFNCPNHNNEVILRHISFDSSVRGVCNDGAIVGESLRINGNSYTSQLNIVYKEEYAGKNVTCSYDDGTVTTPFSSTIVHNNIGKIVFIANDIE